MADEQAQNRAKVQTVLNFDLDKTRLCAAVVLAWGYADQAKLEEATVKLQAGLGTGWSVFNKRFSIYVRQDCKSSFGYDKCRRTSKSVGCSPAC